MIDRVQLHRLDLEQSHEPRLHLLVERDNVGDAEPLAGSEVDLSSPGRIICA